ncbi:glycoside hydrolase family 18 protein [Mucilaginibacter kameinonensis]|uniref:glycoside hydrolase family 18 protein n=1 Tax=Mucilaginibacter kameinonensis TaxID=452286 RepID=UPI000EF767F7|nr:glycoside hydrolase family 18 protein [Mucilaginibacter kameinonensis]
MTNFASLLRPGQYKTRLIAFLCLILSANLVYAQKNRAKKHVIIGYVSGFRGLIDTNMVHPAKLTHINYAFVNVIGNRAFLTHPRTDTINFRYLVGLKKKNTDLKVLISIGGWLWSKNFSDMALTDTSRKAFAASAVELVRKFKMDGIDIDWEYPNESGAGNVHRPEDKQNYTSLFLELRTQLNALEKETGKKMLLTAAVGAFRHFVQNTEMDKVGACLDYINLMTYDYGADVAVHHTGLYASKYLKTENNSDNGTRVFIEAGVPRNKLVLGMAFYSRSTRVSDSTKTGLGSRNLERMRGGGYTFIKDSLLTNKAFKYYRDKSAKAPYLYNPTTRQFLSFDDEWSIRKKCRYVKKNGMAGVMFWEYVDDRKEYLLDAANSHLN